MPISSTENPYSDLLSVLQYDGVILRKTHGRHRSAAGRCTGYKLAVTDSSVCDRAAAFPPYHSLRDFVGTIIAVDVSAAHTPVTTGISAPVGRQ